MRCIEKDWRKHASEIARLPHVYGRIWVLTKVYVFACFAERAELMQ